MTLQQVLDRLSMEGLCYMVSKDHEIVTVLAGDQRADYLVHERIALVRGYPLAQGFEGMVDHMRFLRSLDLTLQAAPPGSVMTC